MIVRGAKSPHVVTRSATGHKNFPAERSIFREKINQRRMRVSFFPRCFAALVGCFPISLRLFHGYGSLTAFRMFAQFSTRTGR
jgi:hypothetical protein